MTEPAEKTVAGDVLPDCRHRHAWWLMDARGHAHRIAREMGHVTIDDVRDVCPPPKFADPRVMGAVFKGGTFTRIGWRGSLRTRCHGRPIGIFVLKT